MNIRTSLLVCAVTLSLGIATSARADGLATSPSAMPEEARATLAKEIASFKAVHPEAFTAVRDVKGYHKETYQKFRNPRPHVAAELRALGPNALLPMLDELVFHAPAQGADSNDDMAALTVGLVEAVGSLRDARSGPALKAIFESSKGLVAVSGARGLGKLCGDAELATLRGHLDGASRGAAIQGLGECMRIEAANELATQLASAKSDDDATAIARALGSIGSSWAWAALGASQEKAGLAVREVAARALVPAFVVRSGETRARIGKSIAMLDHPVVPELLAKARQGADAETQAELDVIATVVQHHLAKR